MLSSSIGGGRLIYFLSTQGVFTFERSLLRKIDPIQTNEIKTIITIKMVINKESVFHLHFTVHFFM